MPELPAPAQRRTEHLPPERQIDRDRDRLAFLQAESKWEVQRLDFGKSRATKTLLENHLLILGAFDALAERQDKAAIARSQMLSETAERTLVPPDWESVRA